MGGDDGGFCDSVDDCIDPVSACYEAQCFNGKCSAHYVTGFGCESGMCALDNDCPPPEDPCFSERCDLSGGENGMCVADYVPLAVGCTPSN